YLLFGAEVGPVEKFLQAKDLRFFLGSRLDQLFVLFEHFLADVADRIFVRRPFAMCLDKSATHRASHHAPPTQHFATSLLRAAQCGKRTATPCESHHAADEPLSRAQRRRVERHGSRIIPRTTDATHTETFLSRAWPHFPRLYHAQ